MNLTSTTEQMARDIIDAHPSLALPVLPGAEAPAPASDDPVFTAALQACHALGFMSADALCVARAWATRTRRTGQFDPGAWPDEPADFHMAPYPREQAYAPCPRDIGLYAVMPDAAWTVRMARAGVPTVQLRFKSGDANAIRAEVRAAVEGVRDTGACLYINDHWEAAIEAGAHGVHLGQEDLQAMTPEGLAAIRDAGLRLGLSTHGYAEMLIAERHSPSYIAMGAVYPTTLKQMATAPQGTGRLRAYARLLRDVQHMAIGGIDLRNLPEVLAAGVRNVGVVRALMTADDLEATVAEWKAALARDAACTAP